MKTTPLGDKIKGLESVTNMTLSGSYVARLDGKGFSRYCKGLKKPFDDGFRTLMLEVTKHLVQYSGASLGYTQSDEITLVFENLNHWWGGRVQKIVSDLATEATLIFNQNRPNHINNPSNGKFDCRVFGVTADEAFEALQWRVEDCFTNAISMIAQSRFSHTELEKKSTTSKIIMLREIGVDWKSFPSEYIWGWVVKNFSIEREFTTEELETLPPMHNARVNPDLLFTRKLVKAIPMPKIGSIGDKIEFIFGKNEASLK